MTRYFCGFNKINCLFSQVVDFTVLDIYSYDNIVKCLIFTISQGFIFADSVWSPKSAKIKPPQKFQILQYQYETFYFDKVYNRCIFFNWLTDNGGICTKPQYLLFLRDNHKSDISYLYTSMNPRPLKASYRFGPFENLNSFLFLISWMQIVVST